MRPLLILFPSGRVAFYNVIHLITSQPKTVLSPDMGWVRLHGLRLMTPVNPEEIIGRREDAPINAGGTHSCVSSQHVRWDPNPGNVVRKLGSRFPCEAERTNAIWQVPYTLGLSIDELFESVHSCATKCSIILTG